MLWAVICRTNRNNVCSFRNKNAILNRWLIAFNQLSGSGHLLPGEFEDASPATSRWGLVMFMITIPQLSFCTWYVDIVWYSLCLFKGIIIPSSISHYYSLFIIINPWTFLLKQFSLPFFEGIPASWMDMIHFPKAISHYFPSNDLLILKGIVHGVYHAIFKELHTFSTEYCIHRTVSVLIKMLLPQKELALFPNRSAPFHKGNAADILNYMLFMEDNMYCFQKKLRHI